MPIVPQPEIPDVAKEVKSDAAAANSIPELRAQVVKLAALVEAQGILIAKLEGRRT